MKACISYISSRKRCIKLSLKSLWNNYNHKHNYPVYVFYFDDIYDSEQFRKEAIGDTTQNVIFRSVPYETPSFLKEEELFYNRNDVWYSRTQFPIGRKGYLHMCHFMSNFYGYSNTEFEKYDYIMTLDDESEFVKEMPYDPFEVMSKRKEGMGALKATDPKTKTPHQGWFDTRIGLWDFVQSYLKDHDIVPTSKFFRDLLKDKNSDANFHFFPIVDSYVYKTEVFKSKEWKQWIESVNKSGGIYKYRWGDNEIHSLFHLIHSEHMIYDLKTVDDGYHSQGSLRYLEDYAPGVKDATR